MSKATHSTKRPISLTFLDYHASTHRASGLDLSLTLDEDMIPIALLLSLSQLDAYSGRFFGGWLVPNWPASLTTFIDIIKLHTFLGVQLVGSSGVDRVGGGLLRDSKGHEAWDQIDVESVACIEESLGGRSGELAEAFDRLGHGEDCGRGVDCKTLLQDVGLEAEDWVGTIMGEHGG